MTDIKEFLILRNAIKKMYLPNGLMKTERKSFEKVFFHYYCEVKNTGGIAQEIAVLRKTQEGVTEIQEK